MKQRLLAMFTVFVMTTGLTVVLASPAQASFDWCHGSSVVCFAEHNDGNGYRWGPTPLPYGRCVGVPTPLNDKISSLWNKYGWDSASPPLPLNAYANNPCSSGSFLHQWGPSAYVLWIGNINNDRISSVCLGPKQAGYCP